MPGKANWKIVEAYVDDVVLKTKNGSYLVHDLCETITNLRAYHLRLNPEKCVFRVVAGKFLGFIVSYQGIEANPAKIQALARLEVPAELKHVQKLAGCVAALSRFILWLKEKALPLYRLLKQTKNFKWTSEA
jgi:hypothetical protein